MKIYKLLTRNAKRKMETIRTQGITRTEYIRYVYGENAENSKVLYENNRDTYTSFNVYIYCNIRGESVVDVFDSMFTMSPQRYNDYSIS